MKDYYYILGVNANCTTDEIKDAYRKLSKKFHPDLNQNDNYFENRFKEIQEAYKVLSDPKQRRRYDDQFINARIYSGESAATKQRKLPRTTAVDIIFTVILIGITVLFGNYVLSSMTGKAKTYKPTQPPPPVDSAEIVAAPVSHHKKKHHFIAAIQPKSQAVLAAKPVALPINPALKSANSVAKVITNTPVKVKADTFKPAPAAQVSRPALPVRAVSNIADNNIPYSSYLRSNITGVVNMHRSENLSSDILAVIPSHSKVLVLQKGDSYYKVQYNADEGYVPRWTVLTK